jgi:hypothetical protein
VTAFNNATVQPGGPRTGSNGKTFFNMEGTANGSFASYGVLDFQIPNGEPALNANTLTIALTQANASFTNNGALSFYLTTDTSTIIDPGGSPLQFPSPAPTLSYPLGLGTFTEVANGQVDDFTFALTGGLKTYVNNQITSGGQIRIVIDPNDPNVAATYAGATFNPTSSRPELILSSAAATAPEPATILSFVLGFVGLLGLSYFRVEKVRPGTLVAGLLVAMLLTASHTQASPIQTVFVIAMENHNWTQPDNQFTGNIQQIFANPAAPYINSLVNGTSSISSQVSYATAYHNVLATPSGNNPSIHPSEPNYIWAEAGSNLGVTNDNDPYQSPGGTNQNTTNHLSSDLTNAGKTWKSYQEDIDLTTNASNQLTNTAAPKSQWTVPLSSFSGNFASGTNGYNGSTQYNYAAKHNPQVFFSDTNGGNNATPGNPLSQNYAPLQQLQTDLNNNTVANYNWITPDQYNDMHSTLSGGFMGLTGDAANIKQGDNFLSLIVPMIMASQAYKNNGAIVLWWDESETDGKAGDNANDFNHTIGEIVISPDAHPNVNGLPFASTINYTHSSDLLTMEEIFGLHASIGDASNATDLSALFASGTIPTAAPTPEPGTFLLIIAGLGLIGVGRWQRPRS